MLQRGCGEHTAEQVERTGHRDHPRRRREHKASVMPFEP